MSGRFLGCRLRLVLPVCALATVLAGCSVTGGPLATAALSPMPSSAMAHYAALGSEKFPVDAVDTSQMDPRFLKQVVAYSSPYPAGTIVVDPHNRFLYLIRKDGQAVRYGVGVGREGLAFAGTGTVQEKQEWPHWTPTSAMIAREPKRYAKWASGMEGGIGNPLGARALYLFKDGKDTHYRIHGTTEPDSIGKAVSSGCIRMMNQDVIDLYSRVPLGTKVVVL
jgi:lipoprotein-anchoring transpeptidase ErfK/SrfK